MQRALRNGLLDRLEAEQPAQPSTIMTGQNSATCIYCCRVLPKASFTREHVLSEAFGKFKQTPVLHHSVCAECNQYFGDALEVRFARGAFEGMLRYKRGIKKPKRENLVMRYVQLTVPEGAEWAGVRLGLAWRDDRLVVDLYSQVAFREKDSDRWVHITSDELTDQKLRRKPELDTSTARFYARSAEDRDALLAKLAALGVTFSKLDDMAPPKNLFDGSDVTVEITFTVNKGIRRCIAKYAFNHLALVAGSAFVLESDFDPIRRFIRYSEEAPYELVVERYGPILRDDSRSRRQTDGHLMTINWSATGVDLVGQVSLFNSMTYNVSLARHYSGLLWRPIRNGLHFNIRKMCVEPMFATDESLLLPQHQKKP